MLYVDGIQSFRIIMMMGTFRLNHHFYEKTISMKEASSNTMKNDQY